MQNDERINRTTAFHSQIASINRSSHLLGTAAAASFNAVPAAAADATPTVPSYGQPTDIICISISLSLSLSGTLLPQYGRSRQIPSLRRELKNTQVTKQVIRPVPECSS